MLVVTAPVEPVAVKVWAIVPSLEFSVMGRFGTGLPFVSAAATDNSHGPLGDPKYAGVARMTSFAATTIGLIVNCAPDDVPPPGVGVETLTVAVPAEDNWALVINAVRLDEEPYVVASA
jgi:hypothetical protein